jgi:hypothetical protein
MPRPARRPSAAPSIRARRCVPLALTLLALLATGANAAPSPSRALARLESEWTAHALAERPHEATRLGQHARDGVLVPVTEDWLARERAWLAGFEARFAAVATAPLSRARAAARDSLAARLARVRDDHARRVFEREPARYADLVGDGVADLFRREHDCSAAGRVARRLRAVPEVLRAARVLVREPARADVEAGIRRFEDVLELYRVGIPARTADCRDGYAQATLAEADSGAVRAVVEQLAWLRERLAIASPR